MPGDVSPYGCLDMAGNVDEWCRDIYDGVPIEQGFRCLRGGYWLFSRQEAGRCADRGYAAPGARFGDTGFRCALEP